MKDVQYISTPYSYSSAVKAGDYVFLGLHRGFGDDFRTQFNDTFAYLEKTLTEFNLTLKDIVKVNVWLRDIRDLPDMEKRFNDFFEKEQFPARMTSTTKFIDDDCMMMIDGVAYKNGQ
jgi:2-iminobutanoate/2-iminopropanoate deaminase